MSTKLRILTLFLLICGYVLLIFNSVNYKPYEFKLSMKSLLRQELTLDEIKNSDIYKRYKEISYNISIDEINRILDKENKNLGGPFESWHFPYGSVTIWYNKDDKPKVAHKVISFQTLETLEISEEQLGMIFKSDSVEEIVNILGEPIETAESYNKNGEITEYGYEWGIKTSFSDEFIEETEKHYVDYIEFPLNKQLKNIKKGKFHLSISISGNNRIKNISLEGY